MTWNPRWRHISQLFRHAGDAATVLEGASDCFEACLARYLRETGYPFSGDDPALVAALRLQATGQPDHAGQGGTSLEEGGRTLTALGISWRWSTTRDEVRNTPWAILWVRPALLRTATPNAVEGGRRVFTDYPLSWLSGRAEADHFILRLPDGTVNDPLSYWNGGRDTTYTETSLAAAFAGAYLLESAAYADTGSRRSTGALAGGTNAEAARPYVVAATEGVHLREAPALESPVLATLGSGEALRDTYAADCLWNFVEARGLHGWVRRAYVREV